MRANHADAQVMLPGTLKPIKLKPGQFITGRYQLHYDYHQGHIKKKYTRKARPTAITIYRWLLSLRDMQMLNIKTYSKYSIITITNWHLYQGNEQQMNIKRTSDEHKQTLIKNDKEIYAQSFCAFWNAYPRKVDKKRALKVWEKLNPDKDLLEEVLSALEVQKQSEQWKKDGGQFIPYPSSWLRQERWEDEYHEKPRPEWA